MSIKHQRVSWPILVITIVAFAAIVYVSARTKIGRSTAAPHIEAFNTAAVSNAASEEATQLLAGTPRGPVQMIHFTLFDQGIFPQTVTVQKGLVHIAFEDKTNSTQGLVVESLLGNARITQISRAENHWRGRELIRLTPGIYRIYDASRPENKAELRVQQ